MQTPWGTPQKRVLRDLLRVRQAQTREGGVLPRCRAGLSVAPCLGGVAFQKPGVGLSMCEAA
eukprot:350255-Chlamydomonas_euryale.AAC.34